MRDPDLTSFFEHKSLRKVRGSVDDGGIMADCSGVKHQCRQDGDSADWHTDAANRVVADPSEKNVVRAEGLEPSWAV